MKRRDFFQVGLLGAGAMLLPDMLAAKTHTPAQKIKELGIILGTVKDLWKADWQSTLSMLADAGYTLIEGGFPKDVAMKDARKALKKNKLRHIATGGSMYNLLQETDQIIDTAVETGVEYLVAYWPWLDSAENITADQAKECAENLNKLGLKAKEAGLKFAWHNHDKEFQRINDQYVYDYLMANTEPSLVGNEMDIYWVVKGGGDPLTFFDKYQGRFPLWHIKDMDNTDEKARVCPGEGILDFASYLRQSEKAGAQYYIVENEACPSEHQTECAQSSYTYLTSLEY